MWSQARHGERCPAGCRLRVATVRGVWSLRVAAGFLMWQVAGYYLRTAELFAEKGAGSAQVRNARAATHKLQRTSCNAHSATHMTMRPLRSNRSIPDTADRLAHSPDRVRLVLVPACGLCVRTLRADLLLSGFGSHVAPQLVIDQIRYALLSGADREVCSPDPTRSPTDPDQIPTRSRPDPNQIPTRCR